MALAVDLIYLLVFSIIGGVLATRLKQPSVVGVLLAGALVGPHALGLITNVELLELAIDVGAILLLFVVGIEFSLEKLLSHGIKAVIITAVKIGVVFYAGYQIALLFGVGAAAAVFFGVILSITSTVIFLKILEQKGLSDRPEVSILISVLILEDIFGVFALTFFSSFSSQASFTPFLIITRLLMSLAMLGLVFFTMRRVLRPTVNWLSRYSTEDTITFIAIGICAIMSYIAYFIGLSPAVGAFLAGNIVSSLKNEEIFEKAVHPFVLTFTALFFSSIGTLVDVKSVLPYLWLVVMLFVVNVAFKFLSVGFATYSFSQTTGRGAVFSGLAMVSVGEFSLLIAREANGLGLGVDFLSVTAIIIFLSVVMMSALITHCDFIHGLVNLFLRILPRGFKYDMQVTSKYLRCIYVGDVVSSVMRKKITLGWKKVAYNVIGILFMAFVLLVWYNTTKFRVLRNLAENDLIRWSLIIFVAVVFLFPTFTIIRVVRRTAVEVFKSFLRYYPQEISNEKKVFRNVMFAIILFVAALGLPLIGLLVRIDPIWSRISIVLLILTFFMITQSEHLIASIASRNKKRFDYYNQRYEKMFPRKEEGFRRDDF